MRVGLALIVCIVPLYGCTNTCAGPSCEATWAATDLVLHTPATWPAEVAPLDDATGVIVGTESQGVAWDVSEFDGRLLVGQPDAGRVVAVNAPSATTSLAAVAQDLVFVTDDVSFGTTVAAADGWVAVGAPNFSLGTGGVWLFRDVPESGRLDEEQGLRLVGASPGDHTGTQILPCPDADGDGKAEWLITAPTLATEDGVVGGVWWVQSTAVADLADGNAAMADVGTLWTGSSVGDRFGAAAVCGVDADEDGVDDVIVGSPLAGTRQQGALVLLPGIALANPESAERSTTPSLTERDWLGTALALGTFEPGGSVLLAAGAPGNTAGIGRVLIFDPTTLFLGGRPNPRAEFQPASATDPPHFGRSVQAADIDGDGVDDLLVGAPDAVSGEDLAAGQLSVWLGANWPGLSIGNPDYTMTGTHPFQRVGRWTSAVDVDGDGVSEVFGSLRADPER